MLKDTTNLLFSLKEFLGMLTVKQTGSLFTLNVVSITNDATKLVQIKIVLSSAVSIHFKCHDNE